MDNVVESGSFKLKEGESLVNKKYLLEKFPGKMGWTYTEIPEMGTLFMSFYIPIMNRNFIY